MKAREFYEKINNIIGDATPFKKDCGILCDSACCKGEGGMYLFPHEECMVDGAQVQESEFSCGDEKVRIMFCDGSCDRNYRPLACRIFPLVPYITPQGDFKVILDPRGKGMCPIIFSDDMSLLDSEFVRRVTFACKVMMLNSEIADYILELSRLCDEYSQNLLNILK